MHQHSTHRGLLDEEQTNKICAVKSV